MSGQYSNPDHDFMPHLLLGTLLDPPIWLVILDLQCRHPSPNNIIHSITPPQALQLPPHLVLGIHLLDLRSLQLLASCSSHLQIINRP